MPWKSFFSWRVTGKVIITFLLSLLVFRRAIMGGSLLKVHRCVKYFLLWCFSSQPVYPRTVEWPQVENAELQIRNGRVYLHWRDGERERVKYLGRALANWPSHSLPADKKRYEKARLPGIDGDQYYK